MKQITINIGSWHYRLIHNCFSNKLGDCKDSCTYNTLLIGSILLCTGGVLIAIGVVACLSIFLVHTILTLVSPLLWGVWIFTDVSICTFILIGAGSAFTIILYLFNMVYDAKDSSTYLLYKSWKDKYCSRVIFKVVQ